MITRIAVNNICHSDDGQDLHMVELEDFKYGGTNITAVRLVDPGREAVQSVVREWIQGETYYSRQIPFSGKSIKVRRARWEGRQARLQHPTPG